jgi:hypothetical protein
VNTNNINKDPVFVSSADCRLEEGSPCINEGRSSVLPDDISDLNRNDDLEERIPLDLVGNNRIQGTSIDMGAYEYQPL